MGESVYSAQALDGMSGDLVGGALLAGDHAFDVLGAKPVGFAFAVRANNDRLGLASRAARIMRRTLPCLGIAMMSSRAVSGWAVPRTSGQPASP